MAATVLLKLAGLTNDLRYVDIAHQALAQMQDTLAQHPLRFGQWLQTLSKPLCLTELPSAITTTLRRL